MYSLSCEAAGKGFLWYCCIIIVEIKPWPQNEEITPQSIHLPIFHTTCTAEEAVPSFLKEKNETSLKHFTKASIQWDTNILLSSCHFNFLLHFSPEIWKVCSSEKHAHIKFIENITVFLSFQIYNPCHIQISKLRHLRSVHLMPCKL